MPGLCAATGTGPSWAGRVSEKEQEVSWGRRAVGPFQEGFGIAYRKAQGCKP